MLGRLAGLRGAIAQFGVGVGALYLAHRALSAVSGGRVRIVPYALMAQPVGHLAGQPVPSANGLEFVELRPGDPRLKDLPRPAEVIEQRFAVGASCHAVYVKGDFAGMIWIASGRYEEDEVRCTYLIHPQAAAVWDFDVYVAPRFRLGRTMFRLWRHVDELLARAGVQWTLSRISLFNAASMTSHRRLQAQPVGNAVFLAAGRLEAMFATMSPFVHVSWGPSASPCLRLLAPNARDPA